MTDFLDRLASQFAVAERALGPASALPSKRRRRWLSRRKTLILAPAALVTAAGVALAATSGGGPVSISQYIAGKRAPLASAVSPELAAAFAILRRPVTADDAVPPESWPSSPMLGGVYGANVALARRARGLPQGENVWIVPGSGAVCVIGAGGVACAPEVTAIKHGLTIESGRGGLETAGGIVPDRVKTVTLALGRGGHRTVLVHDNAYFATIHGGVKHVSLDAPTGPSDIG